MPAHASATPSHFRMWWSLETRMDVAVSSVALAVGLGALVLLLLF